MTQRKQWPGWLTQEYLLRRFRYDPETGRLFYRYRCGPMLPGDEALTALDGRGYRRGLITEGGHTVRVRAHRIVLAMYGEFPAPGEHCDHINGDRQDNRRENLRFVSVSENHRNSARWCNNTSGRVGVSWYVRDQKWRAMIGHPPTQLGCFASFAEACAARQAAEIFHGYHPNHGRSAPGETPERLPPKPEKQLQFQFTEGK